MRRINFAELAEWCSQNGYALRNWLPSIPSVHRRITCTVPNNVQQVPELLDVLVNLEGVQAERVVWLRDWTIWNDRSQEIGLRHVEMLVDSVPGSEQEAESHSYLLSGSEWRDAVALLTVAMFFGWDAHLLFASGTTLVDFSPHGDVTVSAGSNSSADIDQLGAWQREPASSA